MKSLKQIRRRITYSNGFLNMLSGLAMISIRAYLPLLRIHRYFHPDFLALDRDRVFYAFWHGRLLLLVPSFGPWHVTIMTDLSWAGELLARILQRFGYRVVRGSSKRSGFQGIIQMKRVVEQGVGGALAVDGPHGPYRKTKPGILFLAAKLGYPVVPLTFSADRYWILESTWDKFLIPKPFSRCAVAMGPPIPVQKIRNNMTAEALDAILNSWADEWDSNVTKAPTKNTE